MRLLTAAGEGTGDPVRVKQPGTVSLARYFTFFAWGTFGGAQVTLEIQPELNAPWFDSGILLTEAGAVNVEFHALRVRAVVTGGSSPAINAVLL